VHLRRVRFRDAETKKTLVFLTNQTALPALTICGLYKSRWQVEILPSWRVSNLIGVHGMASAATSALA
jgi:hypothetical protein